MHLALLNMPWLKSCHPGDRKSRGTYHTHLALGTCGSSGFVSKPWCFCFSFQNTILMTLMSHCIMWNFITTGQLTAHEEPQQLQSSGAVVV